MISVVMEMAGVPSRRRGILLVVTIFLASLVLAASLRGSARTFGGKANPEPPLAVRVYRIFHLPAGSHPWLPSLAKLITALPQTNRWTPHVLLAAREAFQRRFADARVLVDALNDGANPVALRDKLLRVLDLSFGYTLPKGKKWPYGSLLQRMELVHLFTREGVHLALHGHKKRGRHWLRAALLLSCQDDTRLPWEIILDGWVRGLLVQGSSNWNAEMRKSHGAFLTFFAGPAQQRQLDDLYRLAVRLRCGRFARNYDAISDVGIARIAKGGSAAVGAMLRHLRVATSGATSTYWRFALLRSVLSLRGQLNLHGYRGLSEKIKQVLQQWAVKIKADRAMPKLERNALLRWIKEASI